MAIDQNFSTSLHRRIESIKPFMKWNTLLTVFVLLAITALALPAQTFTSVFTPLFSFNGLGYGAGPYDAPIQATDGNFYGTTSIDGANNAGTIFRVTPGSVLTTLYNFCAQAGCSDGNGPTAGLIQATNGDLYGTTDFGGNTGPGCVSTGCGTVFKITLGGTLTTLYRFCSQSACADGLQPYAGLIQATNGVFYGTTEGGGAYGAGTIFEITPTGTFKTVYSFCAQAGCPDGEQPSSRLVQATNGNFYGTTFLGGVSGCGPYVTCGTVFEYAPKGKLTTLYRFCSQSACADGSGPLGALIQATNGSLYGTTSYGGDNNCTSGSGGCGTVFEMTLGAMPKLTTLYSFCADSGCPDGQNPSAGVIQATDGNFYGTSMEGGANQVGTIFKINVDRKLTTLYTFCPQSGCTDGARPYAGLVQATNGDFYGTTLDGGRVGGGVVFSLSVGLGPFVETQPTSDQVGKTVNIPGNNLSGATNVTFNSTAAVFTVVSSSEITAVVPAGATTGKVQVVTPTGTLSSNVPFRVP